ncbi:MAG: KH domain-containing protein [archaeon]
MAKKKQETKEKKGILDEDSEIEYDDAPVDSKMNGGLNEYSYLLKIPKDRIAALIGVKGKDKRELEEYASAKIMVDSKEGDVTIAGFDAIKLYGLREVVKAISRGFSPEVARLLMKPDYMLEIINLRDYGMDSPNKLIRIRSRLIGTEGKARKTMESLTNTSISVYGKTIGILGECSEVANAMRAVEMIIQGSMHATVFKWLEGQRRKIRQEQRGF